MFGGVLEGELQALWTLLGNRAWATTVTVTVVRAPVD